MFETLAKAFVYTLETYACLGLIFAVPFVWLGVQRLDSAARGSGIAFRLLIFPGVAALWPMFVFRLRLGIVEPDPAKIRDG